MSQYLAPGVYVEEIESGPPPIAGVGTNTAGFVGATRRGPTQGPPTLVTSYADFVRAFGGAFDFGSAWAGWQDLPPAVRGFFDNGGQRAFIARAAPAGAAIASATLTGGLVTRLLANTVLNQPKARVRDLRGLHNGTTVQFVMAKDGLTTSSAVLTVTAINRDTGELTLNNPVSATDVFESAYTTVFTDLATAALDATRHPTALGTPTDAKPNTFQLRASSRGSWGADIRIVPSVESAARSVVVAWVSGAAGDSQIRMQSTAGFYVNAWVEIDTGASKRYAKVVSVDGQVLHLDGPALTAGDVTPDAGFTNTRISSCEFGLTVSYVDPVEHVTVQETYRGLTLENVAGRYYVDRLASSGLVETTGGAPPDTHPFLYPSAPDGLTASLSGGTDVVPTDADVIGYDGGPNLKSGLLAIAEIDEVAILAAPGLTSQTVQNELIDQCELLMDRFAVLDPVAGASNGPATLSQIEAQRNLYDTKYAALYYPRIVIADPVNTGQTRTVAPSGHILGIYSRVDETRGVHKAPANEVVRGIVDVETAVSKGMQEILNPLNINVIRDLRSMQRGIRVYGARCATSDSEWNYINVRRLFIFLEESLDVGTQWVVFEPNDERLWARVKDSVTIFLTRVWRDGALMGTKPEYAFFVNVDRTTMSDDDILNGRLIMTIGIAPSRPAEFVVIRIGQWLGGSSVQEI
jgi:phage tail sheath protein FI